MEDIRDIEGVVALWDTNALLWISLGGTVALLLLGCGLYKWLKRPPTPPPPLSPYDEALEALKSCQELMDKGQDRLLCLELSFIVRRYLERTLQLPLVESTTQECQTLLRPLQDKPYVQSCLGYLGRCDLVKFARQELTPQERQSLLSDAQKLLKK